MLSHQEIMAQVCARDQCGHLMEDHAWDEDDAFCIRCTCRDFLHAPSIAYQDFKQRIIECAVTTVEQ